MDLRREYWKVAVFIICSIVILTVAWIMAGRLDAQTPSFKPTELQSLRLQVKQRDAWLAQRDFLDAQRRYQQAVADLTTLGEQVEKENSWPSSVKFDANTLEFAPAAPAAPVTGGAK